jgi:hypothetical protein
VTSSRLLLQEANEPHQKLSDLMRAKQAFSACKLFDPFFLASDTSIDALNALADELVHFGYPEFDEDFIKELKKEIPEAIKYANKTGIRLKAPRHIAIAF